MKLIFLLLLTACASSEFKEKTIAMGSTSPASISAVKQIIAMHCLEAGSSKYHVVVSQINGGPQGEAVFHCIKDAK